MSEKTKEKIRQGNLGKKYSDETKKKMRLSKLGRVVSIETRKKLSAARLGTKLSQETKDKIAKGNKGKKVIGKPCSAEQRAKISAALKGRPTWNKGMKMSKEHCEKLSKAAKGKIVSQKTREKLRILATGRLHSDATRKKLSEINTGKKMSQEMREKMSLILKGLKRSDAARLNMSIAQQNMTAETKAKISASSKGKIVSIETRKKLSAIAKERMKKYSGENHPCKRPEVRKKLRLIAIKRIEGITPGGRAVPSYNPKGCEYFNQLMIENNCYIQHAENGGEFHIKELGYWVDGYDKENNIVYEYDEYSHYNRDGSLCEKDVRRQKEIEEHLKCKFIRIRA